MTVYNFSYFLEVTQNFNILMYIYINSGHEDTAGDDIGKDKEDGFENKGQDAGDVEDKGQDAGDVEDVGGKGQDDEGQDEEEQQQPDFRDEFDDPVPFDRG